MLWVDFKNLQVVSIEEIERLIMTLREAASVASGQVEMAVEARESNI